ncbi:MAG: 7-cyano-7-deazaguanine synthase QueC [Gammaproteobacteria bacterium]
MSQDAETRAVVLLSGGLDSTTVLALARAAGLYCYTLSVDYGQRHDHELAAAARISKVLGAVEHRVVSVDFGQFGGSALTDSSIAVPQVASDGIPVTYVPARNTILLALALGWAEVVAAREIHLGVNAVDYSGYPDCRPVFIEQFERLAGVATKAGIDGCVPRICAPLMHLDKAEIIRRGLALGVDYGATLSCYSPDEKGGACRTCDACRLRRDGFLRAGVTDPTPYSTP